MPKDLKNTKGLRQMVPDTKVALITGAGSGLGRALACSLSRAGVAIAAVDRQQDGLLSLTAELQRENRPISCAICDVTDAPNMQEKVSTLEHRLGPVDLLIASAGIGGRTSSLDFRPDVFSALVAVNLLGVANTIAAVLPGMIKRRRGHIVGISSLASLQGIPGMSGYCASKAGVNALLESMRLELKPYGISVTTICPGWIRTPMNDDMKEPLPAMMETSVAVEKIMTAIRRRRSFCAFPRRLVWGL